MISLWASLPLLSCLVISATKLSSSVVSGKLFPGYQDILVTVPPFVLSAPQDTKCYEQTMRYLQALEELQIWAIKMFDSTGKTPSGLLNGNVHAMGDYWQCLSVAETIDGPSELNGRGVRGKYCQVDVYLEVDKLSKLEPAVADLLNRMHSFHAIQSSYTDDVKFFPSFTPMTWGYCVPDGCSHEDVLLSVQMGLQPLNLSSAGLTLRAKASPHSCSVQSHTTYHTGKALTTMLFIWLMVGIGVLGALIETLSPLRAGDGSTWRKILTAFSFRRNWMTLVSLEPMPDDIKCVHGLRFIFSMIIYLLHRGVFGLFVPFVNRTEIAESLEGEWTMVLRAFWSVVDSFVIMSGLLTSYFSAKKLQQDRPLNALSMYAQRYYKFTPLYLMAVLLVRNVAYEVLNGPNAIRATRHFVRTCQHNYWKAFLYIGNTDGINEMCYPPAHQLITDMQMYILAPPIITFLYKYGRRGYSAILATIGVLTIYKGYVIYNRNIGTYIYYGVSLSEMLEGANQLYLNPLFRLTPYLFGIMLGLFLRTHAPLVKLSAERIRFGWASSILLGYYAFFGMKHACKKGFVFDAAESAFFGMIQPIIWSISLGWVIFICHIKRGGIVNYVLSWRGFLIFSRLSYAFYLMQIIVIFFGIGTANTPQHMRLYQMLDLNELAVLMGLSVIFTLLFLLPLGELYQIFSKRTCDSGSGQILNHSVSSTLR